MNNPIAVFNNLRDLYLRYLDSPLDIRYADLKRERRDLLNKDGRLWREPLIEPVPAYPSCGSDFPDVMHTLLDASWNGAVTGEVADFLAPSLFPNRRQPYLHQREVFERSLVEHRDVVVTTGTGSGKTECFLVPVLAELIRESRQWTPPGERQPARDWWAERYARKQGKRTLFAPRVIQRAHETRPVAVRALLLYPLNALVEDQLMRLRVALDSAAGRAWLDSNRSGNRIYFGRYTGRTPIPGRSDTTRLRNELRELAHAASAVKGKEAAVFFQSFDDDTAEMWSRWDMQDHTPDLLITNYSMLNIMLMRHIENGVFKQTRDWLAADQSRVFHLVVDELHTYRGTPGTEVAYLLRVLLDRIGLKPDSDQLRIIASSASFESDQKSREKGLAYLEEFFGRQRDRFVVVGNPALTPDATAIQVVKARGSAFRDFAREVEKGTDLASACSALHLASGAAALPPGTTLEHLLLGVAEATRAAEAVRAASLGGEPASLVPRTREQFAAKLFDSMMPPDERLEAVQGLLTCLTLARTQAGTAPLPLRAHLFFRSVQGIWACTNPKCVPDRTEPCPVGKLYDQPTLSCRCGARVLELLTCECCGEIFLGGYRQDLRNPRASLNPGAYPLSADHPDLEAAPETAFLDRAYWNYAVFWPAHGEQPDEDAKEWDQDKVTRRWEAASLDSRKGEVTLGPSGDIKGFLYHIRRPPQAGELEAYPAFCPRCGDDRRGRRLDTPIRVMRTGFQKIAQVLSDALLREMPHSAKSSSRKLVVFSDSRQDAAKLSAGMRQSHYRDTLRQALSAAIATAGRGTLAFADQLAGKVMDEERRQLAAEFAAAHPAEAGILAGAGNQFMANQPAPGYGNLTYTHVAKQIVQRGEHGPFPIPPFTVDIGVRLLAKGMNPGGFAQKVLWTEPDERRGHWRDLYIWDSAGQPVPVRDLSPEKQEHYQRIQRYALVEVINIVFASGRRGLESLCLALPTFDRPSGKPRPQLIEEAADGVIQLLGMHWSRLSTHDATTLNAQYPAYVRDYLDAVAKHNGTADSASFRAEVIGLLEQAGALEHKRYGVLIADRLCLIRPGEHFYVCPKCRRVSLHPAGGICIGCSKADKPEPLGSPQPLAAAVNNAEQDDYYRFLATRAGDLFRLNCEELTAQTKNTEARNRQRLFQGICLEPPLEEPRIDELDLLSVTTTMEAGVDIGALLAVMMANMPPMRFNYQQRVGRAGRRGAGLAVALTLCRGRSHDDYYFQRPERITAERPPQPYVDMRRATILRRVLVKEVLRRAFSDLNLFVGDGGDNVHGEFGYATNWSLPSPNDPNGPPVKKLFGDWIHDNTAAIEHVCDVLLSFAASELRAERDQLLGFIRDDLIKRVTSVADDSATYPQESLSERLANDGLLPMFGFPSRVRLLFHADPKRRRKGPLIWPPEDSVDRDLDIAISQFAPGAETVKDGVVHTSIGVVDYRRMGGLIHAEPSPLGPPMLLGTCPDCQAVSLKPVAGQTTCPVCTKTNFKVIPLSQPPGFCSLYEGWRDFDGTFEWTPRATRPKTEADRLEMQHAANFEFWSGEKQVCIINDNSGRLFSFEKLAEDNRWATQEAVKQVNAQRSEARPRLPQVSVRFAGGNPDVRALASLKKTDLLVVGLHQVRPELALDPQVVAGRAALWSFGFLLRRSVAAWLDIDDRELRVGLRVVRDIQGNVVGQVFLSDALENGAGYCSQFASQSAVEQLLRRAADLETSYNKPDYAGNHAARCQTSCPDCLRDYSNLAWHNILDWRLALDMARLALDSAAPVDFTTPHWQPLVAAATPPYFHALGWTETRLGGLPAARSGSRGEFVVHPLWGDTHPTVLQARAEAVAAGITLPPGPPKTLFELVRRPF